MTAAQRATLEAMLEAAESDAVYFGAQDWQRAAHARSAGHCRARADALRAALGTCGTCEHAGETDGTRVWCAPPIRTDADLDTYPHSHKVMPLGERCNGYTPKEGA